MLKESLSLNVVCRAQLMKINIVKARKGFNQGCRDYFYSTLTLTHSNCVCVFIGWEMLLESVDVRALLGSEVSAVVLRGRDF